MSRVLNHVVQVVIQGKKQAGAMQAAGLSAFTLLELLVVIAMIAILTALLHTGVSAVRDSARRQQAESDARMIVHAVKMYRDTYGKFPAQTQGESDMTYKDGSGGSALQGEVFLALQARERRLNPRGTVFLEWRGEGPDTCPVSGCWLDPWGEHYIVAVDENGDGNVDLSCGALVTNLLRETVAVASTNGSRLVCSWE